VEFKSGAMEFVVLLQENH